MKTISKLLLVVCFLSVVDANAELKRFSVFNNNDVEDYKKVYTLEIKEGECIKSTANGSSNTAFLPYETAGGNRGSCVVIIEYLDTNGNPSSFGTEYSIIDFKHTVVGPAKIKFREISGAFHFIYDLQKTSTSGSTDSTSNLPSNTVVIPTDASGPVEIIMESSKDLVNWTRAEPGTYGADTPKRFFRVRAVVKP